jgi:hypothetical protein
MSISIRTYNSSMCTYACYLRLCMLYARTHSACGYAYIPATICTQICITHIRIRVFVPAYRHATCPHASTQLWLFGYIYSQVFRQLITCACMNLRAYITNHLRVYVLFRPDATFGCAVCTGMHIRLLKRHQHGRHNI